MAEPVRRRYRATHTGHDLTTPALQGATPKWKSRADRQLSSATHPNNRNDTQKPDQEHPRNSIGGSGLN